MGVETRSLLHITAFEARMFSEYNKLRYSFNPFPPFQLLETMIREDWS